MAIDEVEESSDVVVVSKVYGDICIRKARRKRQKLLVKELLYDYAKNTMLHGLPYVTKKGLTLIEKIFWLITFIASVSLCLYFINKVWVKWQTSPVIVTVSEQLVPVNVVPFPSVTICPQSKCKLSVYNFTNEKMVIDTFMESNNETVNDTMRERIEKYDGILRICNVPHDLNEAYPDKYSDYSIVKNILEVAPTHENVFVHCSVHGNEQLCENLFSSVLTSEGVCFNMNSLAAAEIFRSSLQKDFKYLYTTRPRKGWSVEHGYDDFIPSNDTSEDPDFYPAPGAENGESPDVEVILQDELEERDHLCNGVNSGFKVYIHHPTDLPQSSLYYYAVLNNQVSSMALSVSILNTSESLRSYDPEIRQCYFPDERYLKYFSLYTASNCRIECLSNITYDRCGCVGFYMPHTNSNKICTEKEDWCMGKARMKMQRIESAKGVSQCHCLPACNSIDYEAEILKTEYNLKKFLHSYFKASKYDIELFTGVNVSKLEMYFKKPRFLSMRRSELFGLIDFLSNCGGLLGLFLGFSFLSLVEIYYFLTLRLCCTLKKDLEQERALNKRDEKKHVDKY